MKTSRRIVNRLFNWKVGIEISKPWHLPRDIAALWPGQQAPTHVILKTAMPPEDVTLLRQIGDETLRRYELQSVVPDLSSIDRDRLLKHIWAVVTSNNQWDFNLTGLAHWQYRQYPIGMSAGAHSDRTVGYKLSLSIQLSDSDEYDGGDMRLILGSEIVTAPRIRGAGLLFPSYAIHEVTPVTRGIRRALVIWTQGPTFR